MNLLQLKVTEHPGRKSGRFTYEVIESGKVIYSTITDRTYVAMIILQGWSDATKQERKYWAEYRFGRMDLIGKGCSKATYQSGAFYAMARIDVVPESHIEEARSKNEYSVDPIAEKLDPIAEQLVESIILMGFTWDFLKPVFARVVTGWSLYPEEGSIANQIMKLLAYYETTWEIVEPILTVMIENKISDKNPAGHE